MSRRGLLGAGALAVLAAACSASGDPPRDPEPSAAAPTTPLPTPSGPPPPPTGDALLTNTPVVDVRTLGAVGDGRTDDTDAIRRGMEAANRGGGTLYLPAGTYVYRSAEPLRPAAGVTLAGDPGASTVLFDVVRADDFVSLVAVEARDITVDGLVLRRAWGFPAVLLQLGATTGFRLARCVLDGAVSSAGGRECHGIKFPEAGTAGDVELSGSTLQDLNYGLFQSNASTATVSGVTVELCSFTRNAATDLEFNSPAGLIENVQVRQCAFSDNDSEGFGVGLAHVARALVEMCTFERYGLEAVHVEDYSDGVLVRFNRFTSCGLRDHSSVQVISGSATVHVLANLFEATENTQRVYVVNALPGGTSPTAGGRPPAPPADVVVQGNTFRCSAAAAPVYFQGVQAGVIRDNTIDSPSAAGPGGAFRLLEDPGTVVDGNVINGRRY